MRVLAVDPGEKNLRIAVSDPTGTIATPVATIGHISRPIDAAAIAQLAAEYAVGCIIVGQASDENNLPTVQGRRAARLAAAIRQQTNIQVILWDETGSTVAARQARIEMNTTRRKRRGHLDELAATYILQTYLDACSSAG